MKWRTEQYAYRDLIVEDLRKDLYGPVDGPTEALDEPPVDRYGVGVLFPMTSGNIDPEQENGDGGEDDDDEATFGDPPVALANTRYPSSMGMTFAVDSAATTRIVIHVDVAKYVQGGDAGDKWIRTPLVIEPQPVDVLPAGETTRELAADVDLYIRTRPADKDGKIAVTTVLINRNKNNDWPRDPHCLFQPRLTARTPDGVEPAFVERRTHSVVASDEELASYALLYRHARAFAVGHGCSAEWQTSGSDDRCAELRTEFVPSYELLLTDSNDALATDAFDMAFLSADSNRSAVIKALRDFGDGYGDWIAARDTEIVDLGTDFQGTAASHLDDCRQTLRRMRRGIDALEQDDKIWSAFTLANRAMRMQRMRTVWHESGRPAGGPDENVLARWRPFQLAFILVCLPSVANPADDDRELADLLWFPTGGGKTEAYLGLIAFIVFLRRLRSATGDGLAVIMRYTLRLLTIQQFERATLLICCCEVIRRSEAELGNEPIRIGLWVGRGGTPNDLKAAEKALTTLRGGGEVFEENPVQLHRCTWCGRAMTPYDYWVDQKQQRLRIQCPSRKDSSGSCPFADDLPVSVVDQDLYRQAPALLVATADKFAALPWRPETARLFGIGTNRRPPDLIVQDELHLISGPLGTLAGLYETAVDFLCSHGGRRPKVVASTATIRRADRQTKALFDREMRQFPPPGIDARDSYFAREVGRDQKAARLYVGVMAPALSQATALVRTYARLLQSPAEREAPDPVKDPYWTLVGYFNSLRVLGGARMQVQDDVADRLEYLSEDEPRDAGERIELTSREPSSVIPSHLEAMKVRRPAEETLDVILATNMISVGVDIDRLGLMVMAGQPQSTSEYIQATSRVGRSYPGLVVTLYNGSRSRDRSHYESFQAYHSALYRQVESTSVTPFSPRARDRGLHAVLVALLRLTVPALAQNGDVRAVDAHLDEVDVLIDRIIERVKGVEPKESDATRSQLRELVSLWRRRVEENVKLVYNQPFKLENALLVEAAKGSFENGNFPTLWSLRDVDVESNLYLVS